MVDIFSMKKQIICDSSALISLTGSCLVESLSFLAKKFDLSFIITDTIEYESIIHPLNLATREYAFSALKIKNAIQNGALIKITSDAYVMQKRDEILSLSNNIFFARGRPINLVHAGEAEMLALADKLKTNYLFMDERTLRVLIEAPFKIKEHFEEEFNTSVMINKDNLEKLGVIAKGLNIFRSTELISLAYLNGFFDQYNELKKDIYSAALYHLKYSGCGIRYDEIAELTTALIS